MGERGGWGTQYLGAGSVVKILPNKVSPITGRSNEIYVEWGPASFPQNKDTETGWLSSRAVLAPASGGIKRDIADKEGIAVWERMRWLIGLHARMKPPMALHWLAQNGGNEKYRAELLGVIREFGGRVKKTDDGDALICRALRLILNREVRMSEVHEAQHDAKHAAKKSGKKGGAKTKSKRAAKKITFKSTKKAVAKKANTGVTAGRESLGKSTGERVLPLLKKAGVTNGQKQCRMLIAGKAVSASSLLELRDAVNEAAGIELDKKHPKAAGELRRANRMVRRLARRAAKGKH